jgi:hypothetical protein
MGRGVAYVPQDMAMLSDFVAVSYEGVVDSTALKDPKYVNSARWCATVLG